MKLKTIQTLALTALGALIGIGLIAAKDFNVTGGTR